MLAEYQMLDKSHQSWGNELFADAVHRWKSKRGPVSLGKPVTIGRQMAEAEAKARWAGEGLGPWTQVDLTPCPAPS